MCRKPMFMKEDLLKTLIEIENDVAYQEYASETEPESRYIPGIKRVLISAPHGAVHYRMGKDKEEDEYTAAIARWIAARTSSHVLYLRRKVDYDPSWDAVCPYKKELERIIRDNGIKFVFDLHGAAANKDFGIALGTMCGKSCSEEQKKTIIHALNTEDFDEKMTGLKGLDNDITFTGKGKKGAVTITRYVSEQLSIGVAQLEINACLRIPLRREDASQKCFFAGDSRGISRTLRSLVSAVKAVHENVQEMSIAL